MRGRGVDHAAAGEEDGVGAVERDLSAGLPGSVGRLAAIAGRIDQATDLHLPELLARVAAVPRRIVRGQRDGVGLEGMAGRQFEIAGARVDVDRTGESAREQIVGKGGQVGTAQRIELETTAKPRGARSAQCARDRGAAAGGIDVDLAAIAETARGLRNVDDAAGVDLDLALAGERQ